MRKIRHSRYVPLGLTSLSLTGLALLCGISVAAPPDPVDDLKQLLRSAVREATRPILEHREQSLKKILERLQTAGELRRALALTEWKDDLTKDVALLNLEIAARKEIGTRFKAMLERVAEYGDATSRLGVANMIAELGPNVRSLRLNIKEDPTDPVVR